MSDHAYIKREMVNGKWRYWYPEDMAKAKSQQATKATTNTRSSSKLNKDGKAAWEYTKKQIAEGKKQDAEELKTKNDQKIETLRKDAEASREKISKKLEQLKASLAQKASAKKEQIQKNTNAEIEKTLAKEMPEGLTKEQKARWINNKRKELAKLRGEAKVDKAKADQNVRSSQAMESKKAAQAKQLVSNQLKTSIAAAREAYKASKESLDKSYEEIYQTEYDRILSEYGK